MTGNVSSKAVAGYLPLVESLAHKYVDKSGMHHGAEFDDLVQEGLIAVWQTLDKGLRPGPEYVKWAMWEWTRELSRQRGRRYDLACDWYEGDAAALPADPDYLANAIDQEAYDQWALLEYSG